MFAVADLGEQIFKSSRKDKSSEENDGCHVADTVDRLHYKYTVILLAVFTMFVGTNQIFGMPIQCLIPPETDRKAWSSYILSFCYMHGTHRYNYTNYEKARWNDDNRVDFYQWVPLFLCFQLFCFRIPHFFFIWAQSMLYIDVQNVLTDAVSISKIFKKEERSAKVKRVAEYIWSYLYYRRVSKNSFMSSALSFPSVFIFYYVVTKLLYIINVMVQLMLVTHFLGFKSGWSFKVLLRYFFNKQHYFKFFPIEVQCVYDLRHDGTLIGYHSYAIQCVLSINEYNEKLFIVLWFWFLIISVISLLNLFSLIFNSTFGRVRCLSRCLSGKKYYFMETDDYESVKYDCISKNFVNSLLGADGVLLLKFIRDKSGPIASNEVFRELWMKYKSYKAAPSFHSWDYGDYVDYNNLREAHLTVE